MHHYVPLATLLVNYEPTSYQPSLKLPIHSTRTMNYLLCAWVLIALGPEALILIFRTWYQAIRRTFQRRIRL